jgi:hypothetical protein
VPDEQIDATGNTSTDTSTETSTTTGNQDFSIADDQLVPLKINGQEQRIPWAEAQKSIMLHRDYTQKTQALAKERQDFEARQAQLEQERTETTSRLSQIQSVLSDPSKLMSLYMLAQQKMQQEPQAPQPITQDQLPQIIARIQEENQRQLAAERASWQREQEQQRMQSDYVSHLKNDVLKSQPLLSAIDGIEELIAGQVHAMKPSSYQQALEYSKVVAEAIGQKLHGTLTESQKTDALHRSQLSNGIEPRGGAPLLPKPQSFKNAGEREDAMIALLNQMGV